MDNSNQDPQSDQQVPGQAVQPTTVVSPQADVAQQVVPPMPEPTTPVSPVIPAPPAGSMRKEAMPASMESIPSPAPEYQMTAAAPNEMKPELDQEVQEAGVEHSVDETELHLTDEHAAAGIQPAKESVPMLQTPVAAATPQITNAPFTPLEAIEIMKTTPTDDTKHWLAVLFLMVSKKMHLATTQ
jgi:hypothetical protein